ncbi:DUF6378 domain-containing protein [Amycolatopsis halotolerans]|uniref:DUF6378 domain-containing protein n=1 Tax=Amycolatopsis halotolerans TaxID=330083 RepID=A0ABV7QXH3_9PSEU
MSENSNHRKSLLRKAESLVNGDRNNQYGPPHQDFQRTADVLSSLGFCFTEGRGATRDIEAHDVAIILAAVKLSRLAWSPEKEDSWVDLAGYAACGREAYELTHPKPEEPEPASRHREVKTLGGVTVGTFGNDGKRVRYFRMPNGMFYRLADGVMTFVANEGGPRKPSSGKHNSTWDEHEVPYRDTPEWARVD